MFGETVPVRAEAFELAQAASNAGGAVQLRRAAQARRRDPRAARLRRGPVAAAAPALPADAPRIELDVQQAGDAGVDLLGAERLRHELVAPRRQAALPFAIEHRRRRRHDANLRRGPSSLAIRRVASIPSISGQPHVHEDDVGPELARRPGSPAGRSPPRAISQPTMPSIADSTLRFSGTSSTTSARTCMSGRSRHISIGTASDAQRRGGRRQLQREVEERTGARRRTRAPRLPPISSTCRRAIASPRPVPPFSLPSAALLKRLEDARLGSRAEFPGRCPPPRTASGCPLRSSSRSVTTPRLRELHRVAEQIDQHLAQLAARRRPPESRRPRVESLDAQAETLLLAERLEHDRDLLHERLQIELRARHFHPAGIDLRQVENLVDDVQQVVGAAGDRLHGVALERVAAASWRRRICDIAEDGVERRADLVAHVREERRLRAIGGFGLPPRPAAGCRLRPAAPALDAASSAVRSRHACFQIVACRSQLMLHAETLGDLRREIAVASRIRCSVANRRRP